MKPPPPMLPACGCTTASANPVATAASTALPPCFMMSTPACDASSDDAGHHGVVRVGRTQGRAQGGTRQPSHNQQPSEQDTEGSHELKANL